MPKLQVEPRRKITLSLPENLCAAIDVLNYDEKRKKPKYGAFSELVTSLLRNYLVELQEKGESDE